MRLGTPSTLVLRQGPAIVYGGPGLDPQTIRATSVLVYLQQHRVRLYDNAQPTPGLLLDEQVSGYDLDLGRLPRDRRVSVQLADGSVLAVEQQVGGCACGGGGMLRGFVPDEQ